MVSMKALKLKNFGTKVTALLVSTVVMFAQSLAYASVLGEQTSHSELEYAQGTVYNKNTFMSSSVGQQVENFFSYLPNPDVQPIISNGSQVFGKRTVLEANQYLNSQGIFAAMGMNSDFFSFTTGVPMSDTITEGKVLTCDSDQLIALGFNSDGSAFITPLRVEIRVERADGSTFGIEALNKFRQPYILYLYTDEFGSETGCSGRGTNIVLGDVSGEFRFDEPVTATVESVTESDGSVEIPKGKLLLSVDNSAAYEVKARLNGIAPGEKLTFTAVETTGDERWKTAVYGTGCLGGSLIRNGQLDFEDDIAAPRSAVGIRPDGSIVFYTIDGRQQGYSYGVRKETLAKRLLELGCVDAVNLDGGGSTQLAGTPPETTDFTVLNSPSESLRRCANFIFLKKNNAPTGIPYKLLVYPWGDYVLSGCSATVWVAAIDSSYGKATIAEPVTYTVTEGDADINLEGNVTVHGDGEIYISAKSGEAQGETMLHSVTTPDTVTIHRENESEALTEITLIPGESVDLTADCTYAGANVTDSDEGYTWSVSDSSIGTISPTGVLTASDVPVEGTVAAKAGGASGVVKVSVSYENAPPPSKNDYPAIVDGASGNMYYAEFSNYHGTINESNITLKCDGKPVDFSFYAADSRLEYNLSDIDGEKPHLIYAGITDNAGFGAFKVTHIGGEIANLANIYDDIGSHWAKDYIIYMTDRKIVSGYSEDGQTLFRPDDNMTRAEFASMIANYLNINLEDYSDVDMPFEDISDIPSWAVNQVKALYSLGIMQGQQNGDKVEFAPNGKIRRCEFAAAMARLLPDGLYRGEMIAADENDVPEWARDETALLLTHGIMDGYTDGTLKPNNNVTRAEAVKILYNMG